MPEPTPVPAETPHDWKRYPKALHPDEPVWSLESLCLFLGGQPPEPGGGGASFKWMLLCLFQKADHINLHKLTSAYPHEVQAWIMWRACSPLPARTLATLLDGTSHLSRPPNPEAPHDGTTAH